MCALKRAAVASNLAVSMFVCVGRHGSLGDTGHVFFTVRDKEG